MALMKLVRAFAASVLAVGLLAGCSASVQVGDVSPSPSASVTTYTSDTYGFSFQYSPPFVESQTTTTQGKGGAAAANNVAVFDTTGSQSSGSYHDGFVVNVFPLQSELTQADAKKSLEDNAIPQLKASTPDLQMTPLTETTVAGVPAYSADATFTTAGTPVKTTMYFVFDGTTEYQIIEQAATENWDALQPAFSQMLASFTLPA